MPPDTPTPTSTASVMLFRYLHNDQKGQNHQNTPVSKSPMADIYN